MKTAPASRSLSGAAFLAAVLLLLVVPLTWKTESISSKSGSKEEIAKGHIPVFSLILSGSLALYRKAYAGRRGE